MATMLAALWIAIVEAALVASWIALVVSGGPIGTQHQFWYVLVPLIFLITPAASIAAAIATRSWNRERRVTPGCVLVVLLLVNFVAFAVYFMMSGGGV